MKLYTALFTTIMFLHISPLTLCAKINKATSSVEISELSCNKSLKLKMEQNASALISEFNAAYEDRRSLDLSNIDISIEEQTDITKLWEHMQFRCLDTQITSRGLVTVDGYQIRDLLLSVRGKFDSHTAVIGFDSKGTITSFRFAVEKLSFNDAMSQCKFVSELRRVSIIYDFIESIKSAYQRQDIDYISNVFANALVVKQRVEVKRGKKKSSQNDFVYYDDTYMESLTQAFDNGCGHMVNFEDLYIMQHPLYDYNIYGITILQDFGDDIPQAKGWLFIVVEFHTETDMHIHVRTWQPYMLNGEVLPRDDVFQLGDFTF